MTPGAEPIGEVLDIAADLTVRYLADRTDLSASAVMVLNRVHRGGPARLTSLAAAEGISQPAMTQLIQRLEKQGFVGRLSDPDDGRVALVSLSDEGRALLDARTGLRRQRLDGLLATLTSEDVSALMLSAQVALPILRRLLDNADE